MKRSTIVIVVAIIIIGAAVALYAYNRGNLYGNATTSPSPSTDMSTMPMNSTSPSSTPESASTVTIQNFAFSPAPIEVKKGTPVTWTNKDSVTHTVTETDGQTGPKSSELDPGKSYSFTYNSVGTFKYDCSIHISRTGSVTVVE